MKVVKELYNWTSLKQYIKFIFFGTLAALVNLLSRYIFSNLFNMVLIISVILAYVVGMIINYILNKKYNFKESQRRLSSEAKTFFIVATIGMLMTYVLTIIFVKIFENFKWKGQDCENISHILAVGIVSIYSFVSHKLFTFSLGIRKGIKNILK